MAQGGLNKHRPQKLSLFLFQDTGMLEVAKNQIRAENGVHLMVHHLGHDNPKLLTILTDCLRILALKNAATKEIILQGNGPTMLINFMKHQTDKKLLFMTSRLLKGKKQTKNSSGII